MARQVLENGVILPAEYSDDWYDDMTSNLTKLDDVIGSDSEKLSSADVGAAALSNNYNDLDNLPTIPTVNDAVLTIQKNGVDVQTFTANASSNVTCNITVPTKTSDLTNDSNFVDTSNPAVSSGITSAKVTDYDTHIADTDIHVTTADKATWNTVTSKANDSDVVHKSGDETIGGVKTFDSNTFIYNSDNTATTPTLYLKSSKIEISSQGNTSGDQNLTYLDKNNVTYAYVKGAVQSNGSAVKIRAIAKDSSNNSVVNELQMLAYTNGNKAIFPTYSNEVDLGISNYKWKTFNGVEPSSLSLPSGNVNNVIDISSYITDMSGIVNNYTAPANGWISIAVVGTAIAIVSSSWSDSRLRESSGNVRMLYPVLKNQTLDISVIGTTLAYARFIPCQGNV